MLHQVSKQGMVLNPNIKRLGAKSLNCLDVKEIDTSMNGNKLQNPPNLAGSWRQKIQPMPWRSTVALTVSGLYLLSITPHIRASQGKTLFNFKDKQRKPHFKSWLGASHQQNFIFLCGSSLMSITLWTLGEVSKHSCCLIPIAYHHCFFKEGEEKNKKVLGN